MAIQTRIKQRFDFLSNWIQNDITLLNGELAVVDCGNQIRFKIGDGVKSFTQLPFVDQNQLCTNWLVANAISQGLHAASVPYGLAAGAYLCANANFAQALGFDAQALSSDTYSFVWNGDDTRAIGDYYKSHGKGTFSINALSGLSGIFIGEQSLAEVLDTKGGNKITIDDRISGICQQSDLSVVKLSADEYHQLVASGQALSNCLYVVENQFSNMYGQQIKNLAQATGLSDAVTLEQTSSMIDASLSGKADKSQLSNYLPLSGGNVDGSITFRNLEDGDSITYGPNSIVMNGTSMTIQSDGNSIAVVDTDVTIPFNQILDDNNDGKSLEEYLSEKADVSSISSYASKVIIDDRVSGISGKNDLSVVKLGAQEYSNLLTSDQLLSNALYIVDDNYLDVYGEQIKNVAAPTDLSDATNKEYVDNAISSGLNDYYKKSETSSANEISTAIGSIDGGNKIFIDDQISGISGRSDLSIVKLDASEYTTLLTGGQLLSNSLYIVNDDHIDAYGQQLKNLASPTDLSDAATKEYVDSSLSNVEIPEDLSAFSNSPGYLVSNDVKISYSNQTIWLSSKAYVTSVDCTDFIKDGMLSTVELCGTTLVMNFNTDAGSDPISVELSNFVDNYDSKINALSDAIDKKIFVSDSISGISGYSDLSVIKLNASEYSNLLTDNSLLSNALYIVQDDYIDAYGQQLKNLAQGTDLSDAVTVEQLSSTTYALSSDVSAKQEKLLAELSNYEPISSLTSDISSIVLSVSTISIDNWLFDPAEIDGRPVSVYIENNEYIYPCINGEECGAPKTYDESQMTYVWDEYDWSGGVSLTATHEYSIIGNRNMLGLATYADISSIPLNAISAAILSSNSTWEWIASPRQINGANVELEINYVDGDTAEVLPVINGDYYIGPPQTVQNMSEATDLIWYDGNWDYGYAYGDLTFTKIQSGTGNLLGLAMLSDIAVVENQLSSKADISSIPLSTSQLVNDSSFISAHQSLSSYYEKSETSSASEISTALTSIDVGNKVFIDDRISGIVEQTDLSIVHLSSNEYEQLCADGQLLSNALYIVEDSFTNNYGKQIKNVADPTDSTDVANKQYVDDALSNIIGEYLPLSGGQLSGDLSVIDAGYVQAPSTSISAVKVNSTNNYFIVADEAFDYNDDGTADSSGDSAVGAIGFAVLNAKVSGDNVLLKLSGDNVASIVDDFVESQQDANTLWSLALYGYHESNSISVISACTGSYNGWVCCKKNSTLEEIALSCESGVWTESSLVNMFLSVNNGFYVPKHPYVGNQKITNFHTQFATGGSVKAIGKYAHAEGRATIADGRFSHAEGNQNFAGGAGSHAEGQEGIALGGSSHSEGNSTQAIGFASHAEGGNTSASGNYSHAEGYAVSATHETSHAEGNTTLASGRNSHAEGAYTKATAGQAHAEGQHSHATGAQSHAQGLSSIASGGQSFAGGNSASATGLYSFSYGLSTLASNEDAVAFGRSTVASGKHSFAIGNNSSALTSYSFAGGNGAKASGTNSFAYGNAVSALASNAFAIGNANCASAYNAIAIGDGNQALGQRSIALGRKSKAINDSQFVWNGTSTNYWPNTPGGTFNINPELGLNGFYIGNKNLCSIIDNAIADVQIPTDLSAFTNSPGYLTEHQSLSNYYQKSETSSAAEISNALSAVLGNKADLSALSDYVPYVTDVNGNKTAVTIGSRKSGSIIGEGSFSIGTRNVASGTGSMAVGEDLSAVGNSSIAVGVNCKAAANSFALGWNCQVNNDLAFAWNYDDFNDYSSHGEGTFNINPKDGLSGFYIGGNNLCAIIDDAVSNIEIPTDLSAFTNSPGYLLSAELSNVAVTRAEFQELADNIESILNDIISGQISAENQINQI